MSRKITRFIIAVVFAVIGAFIAEAVLGSKAVASIDEKVLLWLPYVMYPALILLFGFIGFLLAPALIKSYKKISSKLVGRFSEVPLPKIFVGAIGLIIGFVIAFLLSTLVLKIEPKVIGVILCILLYLVLGSIGWLIPTRRIREISLPRWFKSAEKQGTASAVSKVLDTSAIIDGRFFDVFKTGIIEGSVIIPQFVLDELRLIADSSDPIKRARGRRGLDLLKRIVDDESGDPIVIDDLDYSDLTDVDAKLMRYAHEKSACIITNDYNLNKAASVNRISVFNINDLADALRINVTAGEDIVITIIKEGKEATQGVAYFEDGTMIVVEGGRNYVGQTVTATVTSVLQTSAGKMIFAKVKNES